jgi:hypothetical protein
MRSMPDGLACMGFGRGEAEAVLFPICFRRVVQPVFPDVHPQPGETRWAACGRRNANAGAARGPVKSTWESC